MAYATNKFVWNHKVLSEQRDMTGGTVVKRFFDDGEQISGTNYYFTRDHLGSIREMVNSTGAIQVRYSYDPYGRQTTVSGTMNADFGYAWMYVHVPSGLNLTFYRPYSTDLGRWLSRDPMEEDAGLNFYDYVMNNPINLVDPLGLAGLPWRGGGAAQYWTTHTPPAPALGSLGAGIGAYYGIGGEISTSVCNCCENGKEYRVVVLTSCSGLGVEGKAKIEMPDLKNLVPNPSAGPSNECPKNREYLRLGGNAGPLNVEGTSGPIVGFGGDWSLSPSLGFGFNLSYCSDTIISKQPL